MRNQDNRQLVKRQSKGKSATKIPCASTNLNLFLCLLRSLVDSRSCSETVLVVSARGAFMLCLARQTVSMTTDWAVKHIYLILVDAPSSAVRRTTVETLRFPRLRLLDAQQ